MIDGFSDLWPWDRWRLGAVLICTASCRTIDHTGPCVSVNGLSSSPSAIWCWWWWWWWWWWQTVPAEPLLSFKFDNYESNCWLWEMTVNISEIRGGVMKDPTVIFERYFHYRLGGGFFFFLFANFQLDPVGTVFAPPSLIYHPDIQAQISSLAVPDPFSNKNMHGHISFPQEIFFWSASAEDLQPIRAKHVA